MKLLLTIVALLTLETLTAQNFKSADTQLKTPWIDMVKKEKPLNVYPRPVMERSDWLNLNGIWEFQQAFDGDKLPVKRKLSKSIVVPYPWESLLSGIKEQYDTHRAWYKRSFSVPKEWQGKNVILNFGAVDFEAKVYINGVNVGSHKGGYNSFSFNITDYLNWKEEQIIVDVFDPGNDEGITAGKQSNDRFSDPQRYTYCPSSGIWQTVWIEPVSKFHITNIKAIPDIDKKEVSITAYTSAYEEHNIEAKIFYKGKLISEGIGKPNQEIVIPVSEVHLWSPNSPVLYDLEVSVVQNLSTEDMIKSYFGMRKISIEQVNGVQKIFLNNKEIFQMGPLDQGYWPDGIYTAPTDEALKWDIENIKACGYNMVRKHIKIEPQRWYYWCDKLGLLVWQDMPSTFKKRNDDEKSQFEWELKRMVREHWNHPSIVNWIVFNEHWGLYDVERLTNEVMALDPSRLVTGNSGIDAGNPNLDFEVGHIKDNHSYRPPSVTFVSNKRATVNGEYGAIGYLLEGHVWDEDGPWVHYNYENADSATTEYERFVKMILGFKKEGLCAAVYTQWTDVENEMNGIYTYDRKKIKLNKERIIKANKSTYE